MHPIMKVEKIIGDLWDRRLACHRARTGETPIPQELPDLIFNFHDRVMRYAIANPFYRPLSDRLNDIEKLKRKH
jgi:hypothetical protein